MDDREDVMVEIHGTHNLIEAFHLGWLDEDKQVDLIEDIKKCVAKYEQFKIDYGFLLRGK